MATWQYVSALEVDAIVVKYSIVQYSISMHPVSRVGGRHYWQSTRHLRAVFSDTYDTMDWLAPVSIPSHPILSCIVPHLVSLMSVTTCCVVLCTKSFTRGYAVVWFILADSAFLLNIIDAVCVHISCRMYISCLLGCVSE